MTNNEKDWFATLSGEKVTGMNPRTRLQARLVRSVFKKRAEEINKNINEDDGRLHQKFISELVKAGLLKKKSKPWLKKLFDKNNWLILLAIGAGGVYATKEYMRSDVIQLVDQPQLIEEPVVGSKIGFWGNWFDAQGGFTGFWSRIQLEMTGRLEEAIPTSSTECSPDYLSIKGCLALANNGDSAAQFNLGLMYEKGLKVEQSYEKAFEWYKKSSALGNKPASINRDYLIDNELILQ